MATRPLNSASVNTTRYKPAWMQIDTSRALVGRDMTPRTLALPSGLPRSGNRASPWSKIEGVIPYASNLINSFRRPPRPLVPRQVDPLITPQVNYTNQRVETSRAIRGANQGADRTLDENTASAVKTANMVGGIRSLNAINEAETNANTTLQMETARTNAGIQTQNNLLYNQYLQDVTGSRIARQRESSENLANAADKYMMQQGEKDRARLDLDKLAVYARLWKDSGVYDRLMDTLKKSGMADPAGTQYMKKFGGRIKAFK